MGHDHNTNNNVTLTPKTKVPVYIVGSAVALAVYGTLLFAKLSEKLDGSVSQQQVQDWIDDAREKNPTVNWPRLPEKRTMKAALEKLATAQ